MQTSSHATLSNYLQKFAMLLISFLVFWLPLEYRYDKLFRHYSLTLIPNGMILPEGFEKKIYFYASDIGAILLFLFAIYAFKIPLRRLFFEKKNLLLWILFFSALFSIIVSPFSHYPVVYTRLLQLLTPIFLFAFITQASFSEEKIRNLLLIFVITALIQCIFAIIQYFSQQPLGLRIFAEIRDVPSSFVMPEGKRWIFDRIFHYVGSSTLVKRASGTLVHSNPLGGLLSLSLLATYSLIATTQKKWVKRFLGGSLIVQCFSLCITYSRSALFAWMLGSAIWFGWAFYSKKLLVYRSIIGMAILSFLTSFCLLFEQFMHRGGVISYNTMVQTSDQIRLSAQTTAIKMIEDRPISGVGFQQFATTSSSYLPPGSDTPLTHNVYLLISAEMGIIALFAFLGFIGIILLQAAQKPFSPQLASLLGIFVGFLFIGGCDFYPIHLQEGKLMFFIIAALLSAQILQTEQTSKVSI